MSGRDRAVDERVAREAAVREFDPVEDEPSHLLARVGEVPVGQEPGERFVEVPLEDHPVVGVHVWAGRCVAALAAVAWPHGSASDETTAPGNSLSAVALITLADTQYWAVSLRSLAALAPGKRPGGRRRPAS